MSSLLQHYSTTQCEDNQWLRDSGASADSSRAAQTDGDRHHRAASHSGLIHSARRQLGPASFSSQHAHAALYVSVAVITHVVLLLTRRQHYLTNTKDTNVSTPEQWNALDKRPSTHAEEILEQDTPAVSLQLEGEDSYSLPEWLTSQNVRNKLSTLTQATSGLCWTLQSSHLMKVLW